jgi:hypothetical protein
MTCASRRAASSTWMSEVRGVDLVGMDCVMTDGPKMCDREGRHRHVNQELQPLSSTVSSSARLAAYRSASSICRCEIRIGAKDVLTTLAAGQQAEQT